MSVSWSPDADRKQLASSALREKTIRIWDVATWQLKKNLGGHTDGVMSVCWSPDGQQLASGSSDKTIRIWDVATGQLERTLVGHAGHVNSVSWSPDSKQLASGSADRTVRIWNIDGMEKALKKMNSLSFAELIGQLSPKIPAGAAAGKTVEKKGKKKSWYFPLLTFFSLPSKKSEEKP